VAGLPAAKGLVRPRFAGCPEVQARVSAVLRAGLISGADHEVYRAR
jgi:hypothetical protein